MAESRPGWVIDANVAIKLAIAQPGSAQADALIQHALAHPGITLWVPDFFLAECASALVTYVRQTSYSADEAREDLEALLALPWQAVPAAELAEAALAAALAWGISGYDAFYVALAQREQVPLVTADEKLVRGLAGKPVPVVVLQQLTLP